MAEEKRHPETASYKIRNIKAVNYSDCDNSMSELDRRSVYSEAKQKVNYKFEELNRDYMDQDDVALRRSRVGFIVNMKSHDRQEEMTRNKNMSEYISTKKNVDDFNYKTSIQKRGSRVGGEHIDYESLYRQIRLQPTKEQNQEDRTIQPEQKEHMPAWTHTSKITETNQKSISQYQQSQVDNISRVADLTTSHISKNVLVDEGVQTPVAIWKPQTNLKTEVEEFMIEPTTSKMSASKVKREETDDNNFEPGPPKISQSSVKHQEEEYQSNIESKRMNQQRSNEKVQHRDPSIPQQFDLRVYLTVYDALQTIHSNLRNNTLLKCIKSYLEIVATGKIDQFEFARLPLHKMKNVKLSLLYERVSVIIVAYAYANNKIQECSRFLANLIKFSISSYLINLRVLSAGHVKQGSNLLKEFQDVWNQCSKEYQSKGLETLKDNNEIILDTIFKLSKEDEIFFDNLKKFIKNSNKFTLEQNFYFVLEYFALFLNLCDLDQKIPFLAVAPNPYLPVTTTPQKYTLVIDILEVMCHPKKAQTFRPYSQYFLQQMSQYYEIVAFSAVYPNHLNKIIDILDKRKRVQHRLYRHHTIKSYGSFLKDASRMGRDQTRLIFVDVNNQPQKLFKQNSILIRPWSGSSKDTVLAELCPMLAMIVMKAMNAQEAVGKYRQQMQKNQHNGVKYVNYGMNLE